MEHTGSAEDLFWINKIYSTFSPRETISVARFARVADTMQDGMPISGDALTRGEHSTAGVAFTTT